MKVMISGVAGFIGSNLADMLIGKGIEVSGIDNFATGHKRNMNPSVNNFLEADIGMKTDLIDSFFEYVKPDVVVHAAASYKNPDDWKMDIHTNVVGTERIVRCCQKMKVKRLIYFQTSLVYGDPVDPTIPIKITDPINPKLCSYCITKTTAEQIIEMSGLDFISFRLANAYGPRNLSGPIPTFFKRLSTGEPCSVVNTRRDYIYVKDLCTVVHRAILGEGFTGKYHVSTGGDYKIAELYDRVAKEMRALNIRITDLPPIQLKRAPDDVESLLLDPSKTKMDFSGWFPGIKLSYGIEQACRWYKDNEIDQTFTHLRLESE